MVHHRHYKHLHVPEHWEQYWSKYPNGYTVLEALIDWVSQTNDMVDSVNHLSDDYTVLNRNMRALEKELRMSWDGYKETTTTTYKDFRDEVYTIINNWIAQIEPTIQDEVVKSMNKWLDDGTLTDIINNDVFNMKANQTDVDVLTEQNAEHESSILIMETTKDENFINARNNAYINAVASDFEKTTIAEAYPDVTLLQVQTLNPNATLQNTADWYALQTLMNISLELGKELFIPAGGYAIDLPLLYRAFQRIRGQSTQTKLRSFVTNDYLIKHHTTAESGSQGIRFQSFYIVGSSHVGSGGGIQITYTAHAGVLRDLWIKYFNSSEQLGLHVYSSWYLNILECDISNNKRSIMIGGSDYLTHNTNNIILRGCKVGATKDDLTAGTGISLQNANCTIIDGCQVEGFNIGIFVNSRACQIINSYFEINRLYAIQVLGDSNNISGNYHYVHHTTEVRLQGTASGNKVENNTFRNVNYADTAPILINGTTTKGNVIMDNMLLDSTVQEKEIFSGPTVNNQVIILKNNKRVYLSSEVFDNGLVLPDKSASDLTDGTLYRVGNELRFYVDGAWYKIVPVPV